MINIEVFYGEDENQKIIMVNQIFGQFYSAYENGQLVQIDKLLFKALMRILNDDFKKSIDLT